MRLRRSGLSTSFKTRLPRNRRPSLERLEERLVLTAYTFTTVADTGGPFFYIFDKAPSINASGVIGFMAIKDVGGPGVFIADGAGFTTVADVNGPFSNFGDSPDVNDSGVVAFTAYSDTNAFGVYTWSNGVQSTVSLDGGPLNSYKIPSINNSGVLTFTANKDVGGTGVYHAVGNTVTNLAQGLSAYSAFTESRHAINNNGLIAFRAVKSSVGQGIYTKQGTTGAMTAVVDVSGSFASFNPPTINDAGMIAFSGSQDNGISGVFRVSGGVITPIATNAAGSPYAAFGDAVSINTMGKTVFSATTTAGGLGIYCGSDAVADKVIAVGDPLAGSTVAALSLSSDALNDNGQIAFYARLADGRYLIGRAQPLIGPRVSVADAIPATEGDPATPGAALFKITLDSVSSQSVTVSYATADGSAVGGSDFVSTSGSVTFAPGEVEKTVEIPLIGDVLAESSEDFYLNLTASTNSNIEDGQAVGVVNDDDLPVANLGTASSVEGDSGTTVLAIPVVLTKPSTLAVTVFYTTTNGSATGSITAPVTPGSDYALVTSGSLVIPAGQTSGFININVFGDTLNEGDETFIVTITGVTNGVAGATATAAGTILNDDPVPSVSVNDIGGLEGGAGTTTTFFFTVSLSQASGQVVKVNFNTQNGTAGTPGDYLSKSGTLTFNPGVTSRTVGITVNGNSVFEADETFFLKLSAPVNATIADNSGTATILNDDAAPLLARGRAPSKPGKSQAITSASLGKIVDAAIERWRDAGADESQLNAMRETPIRVTDLAGDQLGLTDRDGVSIDIDAAGRGWFVDPTPGDDREFGSARGRGAAKTRMDLLSVVAHELGHRIGLVHSHDSDDLLEASLPAGVRRSPSRSDLLENHGGDAEHGRAVVGSPSLTNEVSLHDRAVETFNRARRHRFAK